MPENDEDPPIRLILAAVFLHARIGMTHRAPEPDPVAERLNLVRDAIADADELLRQVGPP